MKKNHGTPYQCTAGQIATVSSRAVLALPKALELAGIDIKKVINFTGMGEQLSHALAEALQTFINGHAANRTWKTVKVGTGLKIADDFLAAFSSSGVHTSDVAEKIIRKYNLRVSKKEQAMELISISNVELGFFCNTSPSDTYERALSLGLVFCPMEALLQLCLQHTNKLRGGDPIYAPVSELGGSHAALKIGNFQTDRLLVDGIIEDSSNDYLPRDAKFIFCRPEN